MDLGARKKVEAGESFIINMFTILYRLSNIIEGAEVNENEIGRVCSRNGKYEKLIQRFFSERIVTRDDNEDLDVDWKILLKCTLKK